MAKDFKYYLINEIKSKFLKSGFLVQEFSRIKGISGVEHETDLIIKKAKKMFIVTITNNQNFKNKFLKNIVIAMDTKKKVFLINNEKFKREYEKFKNKTIQNVKVIEFKNVQDCVNQILLNS